MKSKLVLVIMGALAVGLWSPIMAMADNVNEYFSTPMTQTEVTTSAPVVIEKNGVAPVVIERTLTAPVLIEKSGSPPVLLEDRIIKQKHFFGIGIWPLFDFEIL
jgi:hypothetical protein